MNKLLAHFSLMQEMATRYLIPEPYTDREGVVWSDGDPEPFANDMLYMLDGPEQREAQAEAGQAPTMDAYLRTCRALHWNVAKLRAYGLAPVDLSKTPDAPHYPPDDHDFGTPDAALAIGEHAHNYGFAAGLAYAKAQGWTTIPDKEALVQATWQAWSDYDPPEDIKALS